MKKITPEETSLIYLFPEDPHPLENEIISEHIIKRSSMNTTSDLEKLIDYSSTRVILVDNPIRRNEFILYYLHWDNGLDLCSLDNLIKENKFTDQDFANSIKTFISEITCPSCKNTYVALVVLTGDAYISASELLDKKIKRRKYYSCPNCLMSLKQLVVKILSKV